jgi:TRAP-type C4-dicarboxylate transport system substrate-binding protein
MMKRFTALLGAAALVLAITAAHAKTVTLSYSIFFPAVHPQGKAAMDWIAEIEKRTGGQVKINFYPGGTLTKGPHIYDGVVKGISDIGMSVFAYTRGRFPLMEAVDLPLGYPDGKVATKLVNDFYHHFQPKELDDVKVLYLHAHGPGLLHTKKPVRTLEDMKGMKIRATGLSSKIVKALGGVPVAMPQPQTYEALSKGVVEGTFSPMEVLKAWKHGELIKATTENYSMAYTTGFFVVMNKAKWEAFPKDIRQVFEEVSREWIPVHGQEWDKGDAAGREFTLAIGNQIIPLSATQSARWKEAVQPILSDFETAAEAKGLPGKEALEFVRKNLKSHAR